MAVSPYHACMNNPHWQSSGIVIFLCKHDVVISDTLIGSFLGVFLVVARCNIIRASWETKKERLSYRKKCKEKFMWGTSFFFTARPPSCVIFCRFLRLRYSVWSHHEWTVKNISCHLILADSHLWENNTILDFVLVSVVLAMTLY